MSNKAPFYTVSVLPFPTKITKCGYFRFEHARDEGHRQPKLTVTVVNK